MTRLIERVGVHYSVGPHFARTLRRVRELYSSAQLTAVVPPNYPWSEGERTLADHVFETALPHYAPLDIGPNLRLIRSLRRFRFDGYVVMFDSAQLRTLASLTGARVLLYAPPHGALIPLRRGVVRVMLEEISRQVWGRIAYAAIWLAVRVFPVRTNFPR